jgi:hypothetical protein
MKDLEALGFRRDYDSQMSGYVYRHANSPGDYVKLQPQMNDSGITWAMRRANKIADTGSQGPRKPQTIKERAQITRRRQNAQQRREREARDQRAAKAEREHESRRAAVHEERRRSEIEDLMQPGNGR